MTPHPYDPITVCCVYTEDSEVHRREPAARVAMTKQDRIKAAVLHVIGGADLREQFCRIDYLGDPLGFGLFLDGVCVATCDHPAPLSTYAFANDAEGVTHTYDLALAE